VQAGFSLEPLHDTSRNRPILVDWWYPTAQGPAENYNYGLGRGCIVEAGQILPGKFPLVLLSHGAFGAARNYSWLAEHLARAGFLVAGISHYGESYVYGKDTIDTAMVTQPWHRAMDIQRVLTLLRDGDSRYSETVNLNQVSFVGHSSGGATGLLLVGLTVNAQKIARYCLGPQALSDRGCDYAENTEVLTIAEPMAQPSQKLIEPKIQRYVLLDPALGPSFEGYSAVDPNLNMLIIGSVDNDFLPFQHHALHIAHQLPQAQTIWLNQGEGHFVYLNTCELMLEANGVPLCQDRSIVNRQAVHRRLAHSILEFLK